jgi:lipopolysaccharide/colanic/teichoic acid biosynthesis glycosyltransferase
LQAIGGTASVSGRLADVSELAGAAARGGGAHDFSVRSGRARYALALIDGGMLILAAALVQASTLAAGVTGPSTGALLLFALVSFTLLTLSLRLLGPTQRAIPARALVLVPVVTACAAIVAEIGRTFVSGADVASSASARPWLLATAYVLAGRLAFGWAITDRPVAVVAQTVDRAAKRAFDATVAALLLFVTAPVLAIVALAIRLEDRGPVFYRCRRFGKLGSELPMLKFRKMRLDADGPPLTSADDDRFTRIGRFLAKSKLDELPQLWNVLRGDMSLVGPRPEDPWFVALHPDEFAEIVAVKPGVTGLCQLAFAREGEILDPEDRIRDYSHRLLPQKIAMDLLYAQRRTFLFDTKILVWTFVAVLLRRDVAVHRGTGELTLRRRRAAVAAHSDAV